MSATIAIGALVASASPAAACGQDSYLGTICTFALPYCPKGWVEANGQQLKRDRYAAMSALLNKDEFGGDGRTYMNVPDLRGRGMVGLGIGIGAGYPMTEVKLGTMRGREFETLTASQLPLHAHQLSGETVITGGGVPVNATAGSALPTPEKFQNNDTVYLANVAAPVGTKGLFTKTAPPAGATATMPVSGKLTLSGETGAAGLGMPISVLPPQVGVRVCVMVENGIFPERE
ncbi:MAG: tail fiber protein [Magnetospirillum sp.]|nr:tail fiber protein [Magnetospirillum sp.]